jgi:hypothetical protein
MSFRIIKLPAATEIQGLRSVGPTLVAQSYSHPTAPDSSAFVCSPFSTAGSWCIDLQQHSGNTVNPLKSPARKEDAVEENDFCYTERLSMDALLSTHNLIDPALCDTSEHKKTSLLTNIVHHTSPQRSHGLRRTQPQQQQRTLSMSETIKSSQQGFKSDVAAFQSPSSIHTCCTSGNPHPDNVQPFVISPSSKQTIQQDDLFHGFEVDASSYTDSTGSIKRSGLFPTETQSYEDEKTQTNTASDDDSRSITTMHDVEKEDAPPQPPSQSRSTSSGELDDQYIKQRTTTTNCGCSNGTLNATKELGCLTTSSTPVECNRRSLPSASTPIPSTVANHQLHAYLGCMSLPSSPCAVTAVTQSHFQRSQSVPG